jgi:hypothetical protein
MRPSISPPRRGRTRRAAPRSVPPVIVPCGDVRIHAQKNSSNVEGPAFGLMPREQGYHIDHKIKSPFRVVRCLCHCPVTLSRLRADFHCGGCDHQAPKCAACHLTAIGWRVSAWLPSTLISPYIFKAACPSSPPPPDWDRRPRKYANECRAQIPAQCAVWPQARRLELVARSVQVRRSQQSLWASMQALQNPASRNSVCASRRACFDKCYAGAHRR